MPGLGSEFTTTLRRPEDEGQLRCNAKQLDQ